MTENTDMLFKELIEEIHLFKMEFAKQGNNLTSALEYLTFLLKKLSKKSVRVFTYSGFEGYNKGIVKYLSELRSRDE